MTQVPYKMKKWEWKNGKDSKLLRIFPFVPRHLSGRILFAPSKRTPHIFQSDLLRNGVWSVTRGCIACWLAQLEKVSLTEEEKTDPPNTT